jgi:hypothetical protein
MNRHDRRKAQKLKFEPASAHSKTLEMEQDGAELWLIYDGKRIAKRGQPDTPEAGTWVVTAPGYKVEQATPDGPISVHVRTDLQ